MHRDCWEHEKGKNSFPVRINNHKGFTLIQVLIAVGIIITLAGIALVYFRKPSNEARANKAEAEIEIMGRAIEQIEEDTENYLESLDQLDDVASPSDSFSPWWGPYVSSLPVDNKDPWANRYYYLYWIGETIYGQSEEGEPFVIGAGCRRWIPWWEYETISPGLDDLIERMQGRSPEKGFILGSPGPDGIAGTEDDIVYGTY